MSSSTSRAPLYKQTSLESPRLSYHASGPGNRDDVDSPSPRPLNRSLTIAGARGASVGSRTLSRARDSSSPLKRFTRAKQSITHAFSLIRDRLVEAQSFMQLSRQGSECPPLATLLDRTQGIEDILSRDHMKVAFFGRTSNGKSTVINALLRDKVLPAGIGHTTNCFCSVIGADSEEGYLLSPGSQEKQNVKNVKQLAHSLHKEHLDPSSLVQVFWPKAKCHLLKDDVELMDSPGIDMDPDMDQWINNHCLDADVFVLVSNAESTLMRAEKKFFHRVSECLSKPNIFILNNRWDCSAQEPDMLEEVKEQHLKCDVDFLSHQLKVVGEKTAKNRVFFVSAKEVLQLRTQSSSQQSPIPEDRQFADGWKSRLMEFERFEQLFKECVSSSAIRTKFEHHHKQGSEVVKELEDLMEQEENDIQQNNQSVGEQLAVSWQRKGALQNQGSRLKEYGLQQISSTATAVEKKVTIAMKDIEGQLRPIVDQFTTVTFDPAHCETYKQSLCEWVDEQLVQELAKVGGATLGAMHDQAQKNLIDTYQSLLQLPEPELSRFSQLVRPPQLSYVLKCSDLTQDFSEDLEFHFSLGLARVMKTLNLGSWFENLSPQLTHLWGLFPAEYVIPGLLLLGGALLPRFLSWRILVPSLALYGGVYLYERLMWTNHSKEHTLKSQFVRHMRSKVSTQIRATSNVYTTQLTSNLGLLLEGLNGALEGSQQEENSRIAQLTQEQTRLTQLGERARKLKNAVHLLKSDFEDFKEDYLDSSDSIEQ